MDFNNGLCIQFGKISTLKSVVITAFPIVFNVIPTVINVPSGSNQSGSSPGWHRFGRDFTISGFTVNTNEDWFPWIAIGF